MNNSIDKSLLKQVNIDTIFFFLSAIESIISLWIITQKKKSILKIDHLEGNTINKIYRSNSALNVIICIYFFINAYNGLKKAKTEEEKKQSDLLVMATFFFLIGSLLYLPLGNSNVIIEN